MEWHGDDDTLAVSSGNNLFVGHVGDSRAYIYRRAELLQVTHDQTFAQMLADAGAIEANQVEHHPFRNVLLRSLGSGTVNADIRHLLLESGDQLLLCTDGLTDMVTEPQISRIMHEAPLAQAACEELIAAALAAGGKDNVTAVLARYAWTA